MDEIPGRDRDLSNHPEAPGKGRWPAILLGLLVLSLAYSIVTSVHYFNPTARPNWIGWLAMTGRLAIILWLVARGALSKE